MSMKTCPVLDPELKKKIHTAFPRIVLASASENRLEVLRSCSVEVTVRAQDADENLVLTDSASVVMELSRRKMESYVNSSDFDPLIPAVSADTLVCMGKSLLGKPAGRKEAAQMYRLLSSSRHSVLSGLCLYIPGRGVLGPVCGKTDVYFKALSEEDIERYLDTEEYRNAAGGYRIQKSGYTLMEKISGSLSNVIGLPLEKMLELIGQ